MSVRAGHVPKVSARARNPSTASQARITHARVRRPLVVIVISASHDTEAGLRGERSAAARHVVHAQAPELAGEGLDGVPVVPVLPSSLRDSDTSEAVSMPQLCVEHGCSTEDSHRARRACRREVLLVAPCSGIRNPRGRRLVQPCRIPSLSSSVPIGAQRRCRVGCGRGHLWASGARAAAAKSPTAREA